MAQPDFGTTPGGGGGGEAHLRKYTVCTLSENTSVRRNHWVYMQLLFRYLNSITAMGLSPSLV